MVHVNTNVWNNFRFSAPPVNIINPINYGSERKTEIIVVVVVAAAVVVDVDVDGKR